MDPSKSHPRPEPVEGPPPPVLTPEQLAADQAELEEKNAAKLKRGQEAVFKDANDLSGAVGVIRKEVEKLREKIRSLESKATNLQYTIGLARSAAHDKDLAKAAEFLRQASALTK